MRQIIGKSQISKSSSSQVRCPTKSKSQVCSQWGKESRKNSSTLIRGRGTCKISQEGAWQESVTITMIPEEPLWPPHLGFRVSVNPLLCHLIRMLCNKAFPLTILLSNKTHRKRCKKTLLLTIIPLLVRQEELYHPPADTHRAWVDPWHHPSPHPKIITCPLLQCAWL